MKIGKLAELTGTAVETVRYYEKEGLLPEPSRSQGNYRQYHERHLEQLVFIRNCRALDMTLNEIRELLTLREQPLASCGEVNGLIDEHIEHVSSRLQSLTQLREQLVELRHRCRSASDVDHCGILQQLEISGAVQPSEQDSHVGRSHGH
ncbi:MAG: Cd(II)/Pb(II)-responsive transcriptional regulator [Halopseudomonas sp.]|uniref:Cd(II)/Pb(II)-responsive transcriptional regulator n=1 Tax=Halopseudomonas sp. TaxID=2901191 RepID=UPI0030027543